MLSRLTFALSLLLLCGCQEPTGTVQPTLKAKSKPITPIEFRGPAEVLPIGQITVDVMELAFPARQVELTNRMLAAIRKDPKWFAEQVKINSPGQALPYDPRLEVTESEYAEFLSLATQTTTMKTGETQLSISKSSENVYSLDGGESLKDLTGIEFDLSKDQVVTPFGILAEKSDINATDSALGDWDGVQWKLEDVEDEGVGMVTRMSVGLLKPSGRGVIYYDVKIVNTDSKSRITHVLFYDLPEPSVRTLVPLPQSAGPDRGTDSK